MGERSLEKSCESHRKGGSQRCDHIGEYYTSPTRAHELLSVVAPG